MHWHAHSRYAHHTVSHSAPITGTFIPISSQHYAKSCRVTGTLNGYRLQAWLSLHTCRKLGKKTYVRGKIRPFARIKNAGFSLRDYLRWQGIQGQLQIYSMTPVGHENTPPPCRIMARARFLGTYFPQAEGLYAKLILGQGKLDSGMRATFAQTGIAHVLAISGLHINMLSGFVIGIILAVLLLAGGATHARTFIGISMVCSLIVIWGYGVLCWGSLTALRAIASTTLIGCAYLFHSRICLIWLSLISACVLLLFWPESLFRPGFQMSVLCVITIAGMIRRRRGIGKSQHNIFQEFSLKTLATLGMSLRLSALTAVYATQIPGGGQIGLGFLANLVVIPYMGGVLMPLILIDCAVVLMNGSLGVAWDYGLVYALKGLVFLGDSFAHLNHLCMITLSGITWISYVSVAISVCWCAFWRHHIYLWGRLGLCVPGGEYLVYLARQRLHFF